MFSMMSNDIGIDLGTASILVYIKGKGVVLKEPSVVAIDRDTNKLMAIGEEARLMIGRTPGNIDVYKRQDARDRNAPFEVTQKQRPVFTEFRFQPSECILLQSSGDTFPER